MSEKEETDAVITLQSRIRRTVTGKAKFYVEKMGLPLIFARLLQEPNNLLIVTIFDSYEENVKLEGHLKEGDDKKFVHFNHFKV